jgi:hypothetical protein
MKMNHKVDIVYICRPGNNEELRYSIRSVVKNLDYESIWVVGYKPDWYVGNFLPVEDIRSKFDNIKNCLKIVSETNEISEDFIFMNDDFFLLEKIDSLPTYHGGLLLEKVKDYESMGSTKYSRLLRNTYEQLIRCGIKDPLDYDIHVPMPMTKSGLQKSFSKAYFPRSTYGNVLSVGGTMIKDVKTYKRGSSMSSRSHDIKENNLPFISTEDGSFAGVYKSTLQPMFPDPSIYESI